MVNTQSFIANGNGFQGLQQIRLSPYGDVVPQLVRDCHNFLVKNLDLPNTFAEQDPQIGERRGLLAEQTLVDSDVQFLKIDCTFEAQAAFANYWESRSWATALALNLQALLPQVKSQIDQRKILAEVERTGGIEIGRPRRPDRGVGSQRQQAWVAEVVCPLTIKLLIVRDLVYGQYQNF